MLWWGVYRTQMLSYRHEGVPGWLPTRWVSVKAHSRSLGAPKARQVLKRKLDRYLDGTQTRGNTPFFSPGTSLLFLPILAPSFPFPSPYSPFLSYFSLLPFFPISLSSLSFPSPSPPFLPISSLPFPSRSPPPFSSWSGDLLEAPHPPPLPSLPPPCTAATLDRLLVFVACQQPLKARVSSRITQSRSHDQIAISTRTDSDYKTKMDKRINDCILIFFVFFVA